MVINLKFKELLTGYINSVDQFDWSYLVSQGGFEKSFVLNFGLYLYKKNVPNYIELGRVDMIIDLDGEVYAVEFGMYNNIQKHYTPNSKVKDDLEKVLEKMKKLKYEKYKVLNVYFINFYEQIHPNQTQAIKYGTVPHYGMKEYLELITENKPHEILEKKFSSNDGTTRGKTGFLLWETK